jgi:hypothetical protein
MSECKHGKHSVFCKYCDAETVEKYSQARKSDSSNDSRVLEFEEGKYRIELYDRGYIAYRHGELWPVANHSKLIYAMALDMEAAQSRHAAEREALEKRIDDLDESESQLITERDCAESWADGLAAAIGKYFGQDIGEHSNMENPWQNAIEIIENAQPLSDSGSQG